MGKLSVDSIPVRYSAYFISVPQSSVEKGPTHLEKRIVYFDDAGEDRRLKRWLVLDFSPSSLFGTPKMVVRKILNPKQPDFLKQDTGVKPVEKDPPKWAQPGACLFPTCSRVF